MFLSSRHLLAAPAQLAPAPATVSAAPLSWQHTGLLEDMQAPLTLSLTSPTPMEPKLESGSTGGVIDLFYTLKNTKTNSAS